MAEWSGIVPERRRKRRYEVSLAASVKIASSTATVPFEIKDAMIRDVSNAGVGLSLSLRTPATRSDFSKLFLRRRACHIFCRVPGSDHTSCLSGTIIWVEPRMTAHGSEVHLGVSLEDTDPRELADLKSFLRLKENRDDTS
ncbi:hypothetical protein AMJ85_09270 [candidate division BRC1 bacterium SM23_51]|nr:MAG: hypothetical protein AMJ85_09270 [candidate division BRC1 bacterium SM23_51]